MWLQKATAEGDEHQNFTALKAIRVGQPGPESPDLGFVVAIAATWRESNGLRNDLKIRLLFLPNFAISCNGSEILKSSRAALRCAETIRKKNLAKCYELTWIELSGKVFE